LGVTPINDLTMSLKGKVKEIRIIGDSYKPRKIIDAIHEGFLVATAL